MNSLHELTEYVRTRRVARALALRNTDLVGADLAGLRGDGLDFSGARLDGANLQGARLSGCNFVNASLRNAMLSAATLRDCNFDGAKVRETTFNGSNLYDSRFIRGEIDRCDFENCDLKRVYFIPARQSGVSFKGSNTMEAIKDLEHLYL